MAVAVAAAAAVAVARDDAAAIALEASMEVIRITVVIFAADTAGCVAAGTTAAGMSTPITGSEY